MGLELYSSYIISANIKFYHLWKDKDDKLDLARIEASVRADFELWLFKKTKLFGLLRETKTLFILETKR